LECVNLQTAHPLLVLAVLYRGEADSVDTTSQISTSKIRAQRKIHVAKFTPDTRRSAGLRRGLVLRVTDLYVHASRLTGNAYRVLFLNCVPKLMDCRPLAATA
jgi:hypothetical protein